MEEPGRNFFINPCGPSPCCTRLEEVPMLESEGCALGAVLSGQPSVLTALPRQAISRCLRDEGCGALHTKSPKSPTASWAPPPSPLRALIRVPQLGNGAHRLHLTAAVW